MSHDEGVSLNRNTLIGKIASWLLLIAGIYSVYLVVHRYTPLTRLNIPVFDLVQIERATHVFFLVCCGYLVASQMPAKRTRGSWVFAALACIPLFTFWFPNVPNVNLNLEGRLIGTFFWVVAILPAILPQTRRVSDVIAALLTLAPLLYQIRFFEDLVNRAVIPETWDMVMSFGLISLVLGVVYRFLGPIMPSIVLVFLSYNLYGNNFPGSFQAAKQGIDLLLGKTYNETEAGIYGLITGVSQKYLVYFTILSGIIGSLGLGKIVANIALAMVGKSPATPGRVTAISSVFMGMFSGSGAADTQFVATLTKPLFEKSGYDKMIAAGLVATAGTIALITPPVLGSIAFIMVEILQIPYLNIIIMAVGPCLLYLLAIFAFNEFYTRKAKLAPTGENFTRTYALRYSSIFLPILLIIVMLYFGYEVSTAATLAALCFVIIAYVDPTLRPKGIAPILEGLREGFKSLLPIGTAITAANLIFAMLVISGLTNKISQFLTVVSGESLLLATALTAILSLILGMGVPPTATYVLTASLTAPTIATLAQQNGIPASAALLATHMFLFYYAVLADVTPPVALSAYAAASVFKTDPLRTGVYAARVALSKYLFGFFFLVAYSGTALLILPVLQNSPPGEAILLILGRFLSVGAGIVFLSSATVGYTRRPLERWESWVMGVVAIACFIPNLWVNIVAVVLSLFFFMGRRQDTATQQSA
jgi:TRAP transporter 4TM/12TM fusion protein